MNQSAKNHHPINIKNCFIILLALTAGEVALFEIWSQTAFVPKYVMVLMLLVLTLPKAAVVMIYFMHLKFEKQFVIALAIFPMILVFICVLPTLWDAVRLHNVGKSQNHVIGLKDWTPPNGHSHARKTDDPTVSH